jgi:hypothetical protein
MRGRPVAAKHYDLSSREDLDRGPRRALVDQAWPGALVGGLVLARAGVTVRAAPIILIRTWLPERLQQRRLRHGRARRSKCACGWLL